jgi:hypothetical protein
VHVVLRGAWQQVLQGKERREETVIWVSVCVGE